MTKELQSLRRRHAALQRQVTAELKQQSILHQHLQLLRALCESFSRMESAMYSEGARCEQHAELHADLQLQLQCDLQQQQPASTSNLHVPLQPAEEEGVQRVAPRQDPLALFNRLAALPPAANAETVHSQELMLMCKEATLMGALEVNLQRVGVLAPDVWAQRMEQLHIGYFHAMLSAQLCGRAEVTHESVLYNMVTLELDPEGAAKAAESLDQIPPLLALSPLQLQDISAGHKLFTSVLQGLFQQQQQLLSTQTDSTSSNTPDSSSSSSGGGSGSDSSCITGLDAKLDAQTQHMARMRMLFRKEHVIRATGCLWFLGCLTWQQIVKANVMHWPRPVPLLVLAQEVAKFAAQHQPAR